MKRRTFLLRSYSIFQTCLLLVLKDASNGTNNFAILIRFAEFKDFINDTRRKDQTRKYLKQAESENRTATMGLNTSEQAELLSLRSSYKLRLRYTLIRLLSSKRRIRIPDTRDVSNDSEVMAYLSAIGLLVSESVLEAWRILQSSYPMMAQKGRPCNLDIPCWRGVIFFNGLRCRHVPSRPIPENHY